jgi:hypothetical protein
VTIISASATVREHHQREVAAGDCGEWRHVLGDIPRLCSVSGASVRYQTPPVSGASAPLAILISSKPTLAAKVGAARSANAAAITATRLKANSFPRALSISAPIAHRPDPAGGASARSGWRRARPIDCDSQPELASKRPLTISMIPAVAPWMPNAAAFVPPCRRTIAASASGMIVAAAMNQPSK